MNIVEHTKPAVASVATPRYYHYVQNNSGGSFDLDDSVAHHVIIQATSASHADSIARGIGIYFDGCETGRDCACCGDRWHTAYGEGTEVPLIYDTDPANYSGMFAKAGKPVCHVYHLDGSKTTYRAPEGEQK